MQFSNMGSGEKHHMSFQLHFPHLHHHQHHGKSRDEIKGVPKGCMAVMVGNEGEEKLEKFIVPIAYTNHPLFLQLLKEAEEEYGFDQKGPITIPCHVEHFRRVQGLIDRDRDRHHHHHHHHHHLLLLFFLSLPCHHHHHHLLLLPSMVELIFHLDFWL